jgi:hypothetical protein
MPLLPYGFDGMFCHRASEKGGTTRELSVRGYILLAFDFVSRRRLTAIKSPVRG